MADITQDANKTSMKPTADREGGGLSTSSKPEASKATKKSLAEMAEKKILKDLAASLDTHARSATFACGGTVPFTTTTQAGEPGTSTSAANEAEHYEISPIQIRFGESGQGITLTLPGADPSPKEFQQLLTTCLPASFGRGGEEVLDEDYRKAGKLDREAFTTSFCPYAAGIIDVVTQLLLPQTSQDKHMRSIRVSLCLHLHLKERC